MANKVGRLSVVITAGTAGLSAGLRKAGGDVDRFVGGAGRAAGLLSGTIRPGINSAGKAFAAFGAAAAASATATAIAIKAGADRIDDLADSSKRLLGNNGATGALAGLRFAAEEGGVEAGALDKGLGKLLDTISRANRGDKGAIQAFQQIGLDAAVLQRMRPEDRMVAVADALGKVKDAGDKISFSKGIFGKAGEGLVPLFNEGAGAIRQATRDMEFFGQSLSALDAEKVGTANDKLGRMKLTWEGVTMQLAVQFAPLVSDVSDRLMTLIENAGGVGSATETAFDAAIRYTGKALDAVEGLNLGWLKFKRTITGVGMILADIGNFANKMNPAEKIADWFQGDETDRRLQMIAPDKREEFKRRLEEAGGFQSEKIEFRGGLADENAAIQKEIADAENRRATEGSLGEKFVAWEQKAQAKGAANAAAKLGELSEKRLSAEEATADALAAQTKEKKEQLRIESGGQGKFALMAFGGAGSRLPRRGGGGGMKPAGLSPAMHAGGATAAAETAGAMATAASSAGDAGFMPALSSQPLGDAMAGPKAGSYAAWKAGRKRDPDLPKYEEKKPGAGNNYDSKRINQDPYYDKWQSKIPGSVKDYEAKMGASMGPSPRMAAAMGGDPIMKNTKKDDASFDKMITLLEKIAGNTKSPVVGLA